MLLVNYHSDYADWCCVVAFVIRAVSSEVKEFSYRAHCHPASYLVEEMTSALNRFEAARKHSWIACLEQLDLAQEQVLISDDVDHRLGTLRRALESSEYATLFR
jgi:hypothetical protein